jgi:hypothetical protein
MGKQFMFFNTPVMLLFEFPQHMTIDIYYKGNNTITKLLTILQRESQNS